MFSRSFDLIECFMIRWFELRAAPCDIVISGYKDYAVTQMMRLYHTFPRSDSVLRAEAPASHPRCFIKGSPPIQTLTSELLSSNSSV